MMFTFFHFSGNVLFIFFEKQITFLITSAIVDHLGLERMIREEEVMGMIGNVLTVMMVHSSM